MTATRQSRHPSPLAPNPVMVTRRSFGSPLPPDPVMVTRRSFGSPLPPDPVTVTRRSFGSPLPPEPGHGHPPVLRLAAAAGPGYGHPPVLRLPAAAGPGHGHPPVLRLPAAAGPGHGHGRVGCPLRGGGRRGGMGHRQCLGWDRARGAVSTALRSLHRRQGAAPFIQPRLTPAGLTRPPGCYTCDAAACGDP